MAPNGDRLPPIRWTPERRYVSNMRAYVESNIGSYPDKDDRYGIVRWTVMSRIAGNLRNANHRAYPPEVSYATVAATLKRELSLSEDEMPGWITALDAVWKEVSTHFANHFTKRTPTKSNN